MRTSLIAATVCSGLVVVVAFAAPVLAGPAAIITLVITVSGLLLDREKTVVPAPPPQSPPASATNGVPKYDLIELMATGSMGEVWRARHHELGREVAFKRIKPGEIDAEDRQRFEREARVLSTLTNPHTVEVFDFGSTPGGELFFAMELLDGINLQVAVREHGPMPPERVVHLLVQACASLKEAHDQGLVHRDIKPANFMLCRYGGELDFLKILDFGLVKKPAEAGNAGITRPATVLGTAAYLAPESVKGSAFVDGRADLYALGAVAFWLLTGRLLFEVDRPMAMVKAHLSEPPPRSSRHSQFQIPTELDDLLLECLEKDPNARPANAATLRRRLEQIPLRERWDQDRATAWWSARAGKASE